MANKGLHAFTVQEATNYSAFSSWNYEEIDQSDTDPHSSTYIQVRVQLKRSLFIMIQM